MGLFGLWWKGSVVGFLLLVTGILGWGKEDHYAVCKIAEGYLSEDALAAVRELLPEFVGGDLAAVCSWADQIRFHYHWSSALHYVDTPDFLCNYNYSRDCHDSAGHRGRCVTGAIYNYTKQLLTYQESNSKSKSSTCWFHWRSRVEHNKSPLVSAGKQIFTIWLLSFSAACRGEAASLSGSAWLLPSTVSSLLNQKLLKHEDKERIGMVMHLQKNIIRPPFIADKLLSLKPLKFLIRESSA